MATITLSLDAVLEVKDLTRTLSLDAVLVTAIIELDKNTVFVPLGPEANKVTMAKNVQFVPLSPPTPLNVEKNVLFIPLQPVRLVRRKYFTSHGE